METLIVLGIGIVAGLLIETFTGVTTKLLGLFTSS